MKRSLSGRLIACSLVVILTAVTMNVYAEPGRAGHEAFVKGGAAIAAALTPDSSTTEPKLVPPSTQPAIPAPAPAAEGGKGRKVAILVGIGITGVIAGYLIHRSYVNHGHIFNGN
jgi:hypothetical protein